MSALLLCILRRTLIIAISFIAMPVAVFAQSPFRGRVTDADGAAIPQALVLVESTSGQRSRISATANEAGEFSLNLTEGKYRLVVHAEGFADASREIEIGSKQPAKFDIVLQIP